jgi:nucleotide-binding universal stress UspA family protein
MKIIVAPTDFSAVSLNAVDYATDMACMIGAKLILLHVYTIPIPVSEVPMPVLNVEEMEDNARVQLDRLNKTLSQRTGGRITIQNEVQGGNVVDIIMEYCDKIQPYAIVMGAEGANKIERFLFGGETVKSLKKLKWPLIVIPPLASFKNIRKIGI